MDKTQEIIKEQLKTLPKIIKDAISSVDLGEKIKKIADKNMLHIDQAGDLENETVFVMLGLEPVEDYKENIRKELNISRDRAQAITAEIDKEIFMSIREAIKNTANDNRSEMPEIKDQTQQEIHHSNLTTPPLSTQNVDQADLSSEALAKEEESEDIKQQIAKQQETHHTAPPPPNLPTGQTDSNLEARSPGGVQNQDPNVKTRPSDGNEDVASPGPEKKKPYSSDPYREPIE